MAYIIVFCYFSHYQRLRNVNTLYFFLRKKEGRVIDVANAPILRAAKYFESLRRMSSQQKYEAFSKTFPEMQKSLGL